MRKIYILPDITLVDMATDEIITDQHKKPHVWSHERYLRERITDPQFAAKPSSIEGYQLQKVQYALRKDLRSEFNQQRRDDKGQFIILEEEHWARLNEAIVKPQLTHSSQYNFNFLDFAASVVDAQKCDKDGNSETK